jgi:hypothetical protein
VIGSDIWIGLREGYKSVVACVVKSQRYCSIEKRKRSCSVVRLSEIVGNFSRELINVKK